jgi:hypothetical protein
MNMLILFFLLKPLQSADNLRGFTDESKDENGQLDTVVGVSSVVETSTVLRSNGK